MQNRAFYTDLCALDNKNHPLLETLIYYCGVNDNSPNNENFTII